MAEQVIVISKSLDDDKAYRWISSAGGTFTIEEETEHQISRGTIIILKLKQDNLEYLEEKKLKDLIKKHSEFIAFPIELYVEKTNEKEVTDDEEEDKKDEDKKDEEKKDEESKDVEIKDEEKQEKKKKKIKEVVHEFE